MLIETSFLYTKRAANAVTNLRKEARDNQKDLVVSCAVAGLFDDVFTVDEIADAIVRGKLPEGWSCHHIVPLSGGGLNNGGNMCFLPRDFHDKVEFVYTCLIKDMKVGDTVELPFLGLNTGNRVFVAETPEFTEYMNNLEGEEHYLMCNAMDSTELNKAAKRRMMENAKYHNPNGVALGNRSKSNFACANAHHNVRRTIMISSRNCRHY